MEPCRDWICQGDLFLSVPIVRAKWDAGAVLHQSLEGSAILLTHGCQLDKRDHDGRAVVSRLQFAPILSFADAGISSSIRGQLRKGWLNPPEAIFLPEGNGLEEEAVALLGEAFTIPSEYFELEVGDFTDRDGCDPDDPHHAIARAHGVRAAAMTADERQLLQFKMVAYWVGESLEGAPQE